MGVVVSMGGERMTDTGGGDTEVDVEGTGSALASGSRGVTSRLLGGVCFGVVILAFIVDNNVRLLGFRHPCQ